MMRMIGPIAAALFVFACEAKIDSKTAQNGGTQGEPPAFAPTGAPAPSGPAPQIVFKEPDAGSGSTAIETPKTLAASGAPWTGTGVLAGVEVRLVAGVTKDQSFELMLETTADGQSLRFALFDGEPGATVAITLPASFAPPAGMTDPVLWLVDGAGKATQLPSATQQQGPDGSTLVTLTAPDVRIVFRTRAPVNPPASPPSTEPDTPQPDPQTPVTIPTTEPPPPLDAPALSSLSPGSLGATRQPSLRITASPDATTTTIYTDASCTQSVGSSDAATAAASGITTSSLPANATSALYAREHGADERISACVLLASYTHDDLPPGAPGVASSIPASPSASVTTPQIKGGVDLEAVQVALFSDASCTSLLASGTAAAFTGPGIGVTVAANATTTIFGLSRDLANNPSACASLLAYQHDSLAPTPGTTSFASAAPSSISVTWTVASDASSPLTYEVFASLDASLGASAGAPAAGITSKTVSGLLPSRAYNISVVARDPVGNAVTFNPLAASTTTAVIAQAALLAGSFGAPEQRRTLVDEATGQSWVFLGDGTNIDVRHSSDGGATWASAASLSYGGANFGVAYRRIGAKSIVYLAEESGADDVAVRYGEITGNTIGFSAPVVVFDGTGINDRYRAPAVVIADDDRAFVAAARNVGTVSPQSVRVARTTGSADAASPSWGAPSTLSGGSSLVNAVAMAALSGSEVLLVANGGAGLDARRFDGAAWVSANDPGVRAVAAFPSNLYVNEGAFSYAMYRGELIMGGPFNGLNGDPSVRGIARWDGAHWRPLGSGLNAVAYALAVYGDELYAGGTFTDAGGDPAADRIARWDGAAWRAAGPGFSNYIKALAVWNGKLYAGGPFSDGAGVTTADGVAVWDGTSWAGAGTGLGSQVEALLPLATKICAAGYFSGKVACWDGTSWTTIGTGMDSTAHALAEYGGEIVAGGTFGEINSVAGTARLAAWDGTGWHALGSGVDNGVYALAAGDGLLYLGGAFSSAGGVPNTALSASWNGTSFASIDGGALSSANVLSFVGGKLRAGGYLAHATNPAIRGAATLEGGTWAPFDSGLTGTIEVVAATPAGIYVGGTFTDFAGIAAADGIALWNGTSWQAVGGGLNGGVYALAWDGTNLYVGGAFTDAGSLANADKIAMWNGSAWSALGVPNVAASNTYVYAIAFAHGCVYAGGYFDNLGSVAANDNIGCFNGTTWQSVGGVPSPHLIYALEIFGGDLYAGGYFQNLASIAEADFIARWNGTSWSALDVGITGSRVESLAVYGGKLYAGGYFSYAGSVQTYSVAAWDGSSWSAVGTNGIDGGTIYALKGTPDGLLIGGNFNAIAGDAAKAKLVSWNGTSLAALGKGTKSDVYAFAVDAGGVGWFGGGYGNFGSIGNSLDADANLGMSLASGYLLSANLSGALTARHFDGAAWTTLPSLAASGASMPQVSVDPASGDAAFLWRAAGVATTRSYDLGGNALSGGAATIFASEICTSVALPAFWAASELVDMYVARNPGAGAAPVVKMRRVAP